MRRVISAILVLLISSLSVYGRRLTITADNSYVLYFDGLQQTVQPNKDDWTRTDTYTLPSSTKTIAVMGDDSGVIAGILMSTDDDFVLSNSGWKCTNVLYRSWNDVGFNDAAWPSAYEIATNGQGIWGRVVGGPIVGISRNAKWIWTPNYTPGQPNYDATVYCRLQLDEKQLSITADNSYVLYFNGQQQPVLPNKNDWTKTDTYTLPKDISVIAVSATDWGVIAGILASTNDGFILTNSEWKCTNIWKSQWTEVGFNDAAWSSATEIAQNGQQVWGTIVGGPIAGISRLAKWIWTPNYTAGKPGYHSTVYCRFALPGQLTITAYNSYILYFDGQLQPAQPNKDDWTKTDTCALPSNTNTIAVMGVNWGGVAGIHMSTNDDLVLSNSKWKCTGVYYSQWTDAGFNDAAWPSATEITARNGKQLWGTMAGISTNAKWIWTANNTAGQQGYNAVVYCRLTLPGK